MFQSNQNLSGWAAGLLLAAMIIGIILLSNLHQPPIDMHSFRQCQTGITADWFDWQKPWQSFFNYETPEFGVPWKVPFEFPIYQSVVSAVSHIVGVPIHVAGRLTSLAFFLLTLLPLASLSKGLGMGRRFFFLTTVFWLCSPLYLYWSRTVMIESTAVFFGFAFLAGLERAIATRKWYWWLLAFVASLACALVKVTSYPPFGLAALGILIWKTAPFRLKEIGSRETLRRILPSLLGIAAIGMVTVATTSAWTHYADSIKSQNEIAQSLTSKNLGGWNFGTMAQKTDSENWRKLMDRSIPEAIGAYWVLGFLLGAGCFLNGKRAILLMGLLVLFLLPFSLFTNLHLVHNYYQYANSFWLVLALGLAVSEMSKRIPCLLAGLVVLAIVGAQLATYFQAYYQSTRIQTTGALEAAKYVTANSKKEQSIFVIGDDWSPELAFLAGRRAVYIPKWLSHERAAAFFKKIRENPSSVFSSYPPAFLIVNPSRLAIYPKDLREVIDQLLIQIGKAPNSKRVQIGGYELLQSSVDKRGLRIETAQSLKPEILHPETQSLFESLSRKLLGSTFDIELKPGGIFIHPGGQPTEATFNISGQFQSVHLVGFITELPENGLADPQAGTVGMEIFVDGKSQGRRLVDRHTNQTYQLDLTKANELKVVVDYGNRTAIWDHFHLGIAKDSPNP